MGGAFLVSGERFYEGAQLLLYLPLGNGTKDQLCIVSGKVVRISKNAQHAIDGYGIQFDSSISLTSKQALKKYVETRNGGVSLERETNKDFPIESPIPLPIKRVIQPELLDRHEATQVAKNPVAFQSPRATSKKNSPNLALFTVLVAISLALGYAAHTYVKVPNLFH